MDINHIILDKEAINRFEQYTPAKPAINGGILLETCQDVDSMASTSKKRAQTPRQKVICCFCFKTTKYRRKQFIIGSLTNMVIFFVLLAYTFLGSIIFLTIEGETDVTARPRLLPDKQKISQNDHNSTNKKYVEDDLDYTNLTVSANYFWDARSKTVENIWEITVSLNILYRENWTRLAAQEILKFQNELIQRVTTEMATQYGVSYKELALGEFGTSDSNNHYEEHEWNLALAFFYSLTVLTTIGYGNIAPRTILGKGATILYAIIGIPLTLLYLSSVGSLLSKMARSVFSRALCCCLCSNCGYCCYDERRMAEKERRMKLRRQQEEILNSQNTSKTPTEECYVLKSDSHKDSSCSERPTTSTAKDDVISWPDTDSKLSMHGLSILAPVLLCLAAIFIYITLGAIILYKLDNMSIIDGFYFCFMALSTIGFGSIIPGMSYTTIHGVRYYTINSTTLWFCSVYTLTGLALTAMCFGVIHDEIIYRIKHQQKEWSQKNNTVNDEVNINDPFYMSS
ncbi:PREDICTED: TWiK family of potassium channels protein 12-like [Papilio polytes]|uniref:TWiK family of potassium channels protein 12-like n=1 Tax=Papilio polytes TaxID=76194 RepID=UPI000676286A|nr:PREDICTED: TWiK family of potassium channels protein 12-like [Papilio polytes]XP_013144539.1 PREDICTED: TWiK family of potassium channels protein 12-like [Papilio polytes]XP_013144547.1 PREDICTED: TWiK family of potassium channels protein 12-like [Papilio polytes]XP_013144556.1 PREDICTED: TWiK family of potassium channels protein 12-like [Papilio polytes]XP_013144564.1 PREDICTED: TWiK family of potassium channels protein 12-like [Papilio polytes]